MHALFAPGVRGDLFTLRRIPSSTSTTRGFVLFVPPFAEEMNKCRRMMSLQSQRLCDDGFETWQYDLYGTGDSAGEFEDATFDTWCTDTAGILQSMAGGAGTKPVIVIGVRFGAILAMEAIVKANIRVDKVVMWHPVLSGREEIRQMKRLHSLSGVISEAGSKPTDQTGSPLPNSSIELGGYSLSTVLISELERLFLLESIESFNGRLFWIDVSAAPETQSAGRRQTALNEAKQLKAGLVVKRDKGNEFWRTAEITTAEKVLATTTEILSS